MIVLKNLVKKYKTNDGEIVAVDGVQAHIDKGEIFGVIGYSGAGKSTLVRLLNRLEEPSAGTVEIDGQNITNMDTSSLRKARQEIGMIFQHFNLLWSRTIYDNIAFPLEIAGVSKAEREKRVNDLIKLVGLEGREHAYPAQLSGGQKQRVGIARALANRPKVLLCDEATSALDPQTTDSILDLLVDINKRLGLTIVLITHEMHVIRKICHKVAVMEKGKIVEQGPVLDVFRQPKQNVTKRFVKEISGPNASFENLLKTYPEGKLLKLSFVGNSAEKPLITELIRQFPIEVNILQGNISQTHEGAYGTLIIQLVGKEADLDAALAFIQVRTAGVEVIQGD